jgi:hypothetical protein
MNGAGCINSSAAIGAGCPEADMSRPRLRLAPVPAPFRGRVATVWPRSDRGLDADEVERSTEYGNELATEPPPSVWVCRRGSCRTG